MHQIIVDASVACKLFLEGEPDRDKAVQLFEIAAIGRIKLVAPTVFSYELLSILRRAKFSPEKDALVLEMLFKQFHTIVELVAPQEHTFSKALEICRTGHIKSGFPSAYDSTYHALAIERNTVFLTADKKHLRKTEKFKHILLLENFKPEMFYT